MAGKNTERIGKEGRVSYRVLVEVPTVVDGERNKYNRLESCRDQQVTMSKWKVNRA